MIKKEMYPKTKRMPCIGSTIQLTEKLDGSNLAMYKHDGELFICQRTTVFSLSEIQDMGNSMYPGLKGFLDKYGIYLATNLHEGSVICGEWLGMGKLKYDFENRYFMFAKARYNAELDKFENFNYEHDDFKWVFDNHETDGFPSFISMVPVVADISYLPNKIKLDELYKNYVESQGRDVEGFVINYHGHIEKYVRMKNGKLSEHFDRE